MDFFTRLKPQLTKAHPNLMEIGLRYHNISKVSFNVENRHFFAVPDDAPNQNFSNCFRLLSEAVGEQPITVYDSYHHPLHRSFYYLRLEKAIVYFDGAVGTSCGLFLGAESCMSRVDHNSRCQQSCFSLLKGYNLTWLDLWKPEKSKQRPNNVIKRFKEVFVIAAQWDHNYYHFHMDSLARLAHHLPFLRRYPDIKIHLYLNEDYDRRLWINATTVNNIRNMRSRIFGLLGLNPSRIVSNAVYADVIYVPRATHCSHPASNLVEIHLLARELLQGAFQYLATMSTNLPTLIQQLLLEGNMRPKHFNATEHFKSTFRPSFNGKKLLLIMQREDGDGSRIWTEGFTLNVQSAFEENFPEHKVIKIASTHEKSPDYCSACDIFLFSQADIFVAEHGAGIANVMFMRPGGLLIETVSHIDDRHLPMCGYYNSLAGGIGIHHYIYSYRNQRNGLPEYKMNFADLAGSAAQYYQNITLYEAGKWNWYHAA
eukprot:gene27960-33763_t